MISGVLSTSGNAELLKKGRWINTAKSISILEINLILILHDAYENDATFHQFNTAINFSILTIHWFDIRNEEISIS